MDGLRHRPTKRKIISVHHSNLDAATATVTAEDDTDLELNMRQNEPQPMEVNTVNAKLGRENAQLVTVIENLKRSVDRLNLNWQQQNQ